MPYVLVGELQDRLRAEISQNSRCWLTKLRGHQVLWTRYESDVTDLRNFICMFCRYRKTLDIRWHCTNDSDTWLVNVTTELWKCLRLTPRMISFLNDVINITHAVKIANWPVIRWLLPFRGLWDENLSWSSLRALSKAEVETAISLTCVGNKALKVRPHGYVPPEKVG